VNPTPTRQGTPRVQARAVLQAFGTIHHETLQKRILSPGRSPSKTNALRDNHGRLDRCRELSEGQPIDILSRVSVIFEAKA
jgi:hypothetical protein